MFSLASTNTGGLCKVSLLLIDDFHTPKDIVLLYQLRTTIWELEIKVDISYLIDSLLCGMLLAPGLSGIQSEIFSICGAKNNWYVFLVTLSEVFCCYYDILLARLYPSAHCSAIPYYSKITEASMPSLTKQQDNHLNTCFKHQVTTCEVNVFVKSSLNIQSAHFSNSKSAVSTKICYCPAYFAD